MRNYLTAFFTLLTVVLIGQPRFPALSPEGSIHQKVGLTTISVTYERPAARGRQFLVNSFPMENCGGLELVTVPKLKLVMMLW